MIIYPHIGYLLVWYFLSYSLFGQWLESSMSRHVLIQIPALVLIGYCYGKRHLQHKLLFSLNEKGLAGMLLCIFIGGYWMLPRAIDAALADPVIALAKYLSLPFLVGAPLALSWHKIHCIAKAVIVIELITMLYRLGWLYLVSPNRLCNFYQLNEQVALGWYFLIIGTIISLYFLLPLFFADCRSQAKGTAKSSQQFV